jgi:hypothetical protein
MSNPLTLNLNLGGEQITTISGYVNLICNKLGIEGDPRKTIIDTMSSFDDNKVYEIVKGVEVQLDELIKADDRLKALIDTGALAEYKDRIKDQWNKTMGELGKLQGYIIIKRLNTAKATGDCKSVIEELLKAFETKLAAVNAILQSNIQTPSTQAGGNSNEYYKEKYLKYKIKYFNLKNK